MVRAALKKFVDEQMKPGDLVAIIRTGAGMGALQQFTNDKNQLHAAIERVRWSPKYGAINTFAPVQTGFVPIAGTGFGPGVNVNTVGTRDTNAPKFRDLDGTFDRTIPGKENYEVDQLRQEVFAVGTLGAVGFLI